MKFTYPIIAFIAFSAFALNTQAQRPGGDRGGASGGFGRQGNPPAGMNQNNANLQNQAFGNQNAAIQNFCN